ncbi:MAG: hypothetical protein WBG48_17885 [Pricia sp.]
MKNVRKFVLKFGVALILLIGVVGCEGCETLEPEAVITEKDVKDIIIPVEQAKELYDTYSERRVGLIRDFENELDSLDQDKDSDNQDPKGQYKKDELRKAAEQKRMALQAGKGFQPTRYSFYDYESLKKYMAFIEQEAAKANVKISTLRFYFANYPNKDSFDVGRPVKEPRRNTLVFIPTVNTGQEEFAFFTADDSKDGQRKAFLLDEQLVANEDTFGGKAKSEASFSLNSSLNTSNAPLPPQNEQSLAGNEFGLRPPK